MLFVYFIFSFVEGVSENDSGATWYSEADCRLGPSSMWTSTVTECSKASGNSRHEAPPAKEETRDVEVEVAKATAVRAEARAVTKAMTKADEVETCAT